MQNTVGGWYDISYRDAVRSGVAVSCGEWVTRNWTPVLIKDVETLLPVDASKSYNCVIQMGSTVMWRTCLGGGWRVAGGKNTHVPVIHETGPVSGSVVNGMIQAHNKWVIANRGGRPDGYAARQFLVICSVEC